MECQYCHREFKTKSSLNLHIKTARYCIKLRKKPIPDNEHIHTCEYCNKTFTTRQASTNHKKKCYSAVKNAVDNNSNKLNEIIDRQTNEIKRITELATNMKTEIERLTQLVIDMEAKNKMYYDPHIVNLEHRIEKYESQILDIAKQPRQTIHDSSVHVNLPPLTREHLEDSAQFLSMDHIKKGFPGYAEYALEYPLKGLVTCTDYSRRKVKYNNENGETVIDPDMKKICINLFKAIRNRNQDLTTEYMNEMKELAETGKWDRTDLQDLVFEAITRNGEVIAIANGNRPDAITDFIKLVCSGLTSSIPE